MAVHFICHFRFVPEVEIIEIKRKCIDANA